MKRHILVFSILLLWFSISFAFHGDVIRTLTLDASSIQKLKMDCGAGYLHITGNPSLNEIRIKAEIVMKDTPPNVIQKIFAKYGKLELSQQGNVAVLIAGKKENISFIKRIFSNIDEIRINLDIELPPNIQLEILDGSGEITVNQMNGDISCTDGSGSLIIKNIVGSLRVNDGSGFIEIEQVQGDIKVVDGSGSLNIQNVTGNVKVNDGAGSCTLSGIDGNVFILDGSDDIDVNHVQKDVTIDDGSGDIILNYIRGNVILLSTGSGETIFKNIQGDIIKNK